MRLYMILRGKEFHSEGKINYHGKEFYYGNAGYWLPVGTSYSTTLKTLNSIDNLYTCEGAQAAMEEATRDLLDKYFNIR